MRAIFVVLDGLGDMGIWELGGRTPLQAAETPNMDFIAASGATGLYHSTQQGIAMPSEMAHFIMFGYEMAEFPGRGYIEALGHGIPVAEGEVAFLARFLRGAFRRGFVWSMKRSVEPKEMNALAGRRLALERRRLEMELFHRRNGGIAVVRAGQASSDRFNPIFEGAPSWRSSGSREPPIRAVLGPPIF